MSTNSVKKTVSFYGLPMRDEQGQVARICHIRIIVKYQLEAMSCWFYSSLCLIGFDIIKIYLNVSESGSFSFDLLRSKGLFHQLARQASSNCYDLFIR